MQEIANGETRNLVREIYILTENGEKHKTIPEIKETLIAAMSWLVGENIGPAKVVQPQIKIFATHVLGLPSLDFGYSLKKRAGEIKILKVTITPSEVDNEIIAFLKKMKPRRSNQSFAHSLPLICPQQGNRSPHYLSLSSHSLFNGPDRMPC